VGAPLPIPALLTLTTPAQGGEVILVVPSSVILTPRHCREHSDPAVRAAFVATSVPSDEMVRA
jgi:hypothetical protein